MIIRMEIQLTACSLRMNVDIARSSHGKGPRATTAQQPKFADHLEKPNNLVGLRLSIGRERLFYRKLCYGSYLTGGIP